MPLCHRRMCDVLRWRLYSCCRYVTDPSRNGRTQLHVQLGYPAPSGGNKPLCWRTHRLSSYPSPSQCTLVGSHQSRRTCRRSDHCPHSNVGQYRSHPSNSLQLGFLRTSIHPRCLQSRTYDVGQTQLTHNLLKGYANIPTKDPLTDSILVGCDRDCYQSLRTVWTPFHQLVQAWIQLIPIRSPLRIVVAGFVFFIIYRN